MKSVTYILRCLGQALIYLFILNSSVYGQNTEIKNLIFEGAGIRGLAYAGVVQSLEEYQVLDQVDKVGGTSAGAIIALLIALEYNSEELTAIISDTKFQQFNDGKYFFVGGISRTVKRYGWYQGEKFTDWIGELISMKTGNADITFGQFSDQGYKDLYLTATCLNRQQLVVLSRLSYPNMKVKDAVRISMSIPIYYQAVFVDSVGTTYQNPIEGKNLDVMVDGGIVGNFPIQIFDEVVLDSLGQKIRIPNPQTLGIRIDTESQIAEDAKTKELATYPINNFQEYVGAFYTIIIESLNRQLLTEDDWKRTISVSAVGIGPNVKKLSNKQKEDLIKSGVEGASAFLEGRAKSN